MADEKQEESVSITGAAKVTISRGSKGYKLPLAKLSLSGTVTASSEDDANRVVQRAIIFVVDRSGSMSGGRINMIKDALKPFIQQICSDENTILKLVLFDHQIEVVDIPRDAVEAASTIEKRVNAQGGTDFFVASQGLVTEAQQILEQNPSYQLTVIMASDGEVGKDNARKGHEHWKEFVNQQYLKVHKIPPYVETIGISSAHDADVLDGFIADDAAGNYVKCETPDTIREAFENAQNETMGRTATKLSLTFPCSAFSDVYQANKQQHVSESKVRDLIVTSDEFKQDFWINITEFDNLSKGNKELQLYINGEAVAIKVKEITDAEECQYEAIDFYNQVLNGMLSVLRTITDAEQLKTKAKEIEDELNSAYVQTFEAITVEPVEKQKLQNEIKQLLLMQGTSSTNDNEEDDDDAKQMPVDADMVKRRAELMKKYKMMNKIWKKHKTIVSTFQNTLATVKQLVREIVLGQVRMQEIRQHILDLHFRKKHAKRINKLILTDEQLAKRQEMYDEIEKPTEQDCASITDEIGTGCYLSTLSKREVVMDGDPLWICGRVNRSGGAAVSNPELIKIDYISPDLVSDSYFRMALEAAGSDSSKNDVNAAFADSSRQLINARLFPVYGNEKHYKCSKPYINEVLAHTLSGRIDIRVVDYNSLCTTIGHMISRNNLTTKNLKRIFTEVIPSFELFINKTYAKAYKSDGTYNREPDADGERIKLKDRNRIRLEKYLETFKARTTGWVSEAQTLFADRLMNLDLDFGHEFYLSVITQRLRQIFNAQIPKQLEQDELRLKVAENHRKLIQVLVCGVDNETDEKDAVLDFSKNTDSAQKKRFYELVQLPHIEPKEIDKDDEKLAKEYKVNRITPSMKQMLVDILSRVNVRDLLQANFFFNALSRMKCDSDLNQHGFEEFRNQKFSNYKKIDNDLNELFREIGYDAAKQINVLRAICCISILCYSNRKWLDGLVWFADDETKQIFNDPDAILARIYKHHVIKDIRNDYEVYLENKRIHELIELHSNPLLPDDVDENGNLPELRCGWKRCGKEFDNRDKLLNHVSRCMPKERPFIHRFHLHSRTVLEANPDLAFEEFSKQVLALFDDKKRKNVTESELKAYYQQFQPFFKQRQSAQK